MEFRQLQQHLAQITKQRMPLHLQRIDWSRQQLLQYQLNQLRTLLSHAKQRTRYYQRRLSNIDVSSFQLSDIKSIPILTKQDTLNYWDDFVTDQVITRTEAEHHLQKLRDGETTNPFYKDRYLLFATGGSSGQRGLFVWEIDGFAEVICAHFRYQVHDNGGSVGTNNKIAAIVAPSWLHASVPLCITNINESAEIKHFSTQASLNELAGSLAEFQPTQLVGYSTVIVELSHLTLAGKLAIKPNRVMTLAEPLDGDGRHWIRQAWGIEVNNGWGSTEIGNMGIEDDQHLGMWLSEDCSILEPVNDNLQPVDHPQEAKKLIATNLCNFAFPVIRYVVDDAVIIKRLTGKTYRIASDIQGRTDDWFRYHNDIKIHPMVFRHVLGQDKDIEEYQVAQTKNGAEIRLIGTAPLSLSGINNRLINELSKSGLNDADIQIEQVRVLPRHKETGKLKRFIPLK